MLAIQPRICGSIANGYIAMYIWPYSQLFMGIYSQRCQHCQPCQNFQNFQNFQHFKHCLESVKIVKIDKCQNQPDCLNLKIVKNANV